MKPRQKNHNYRLRNLTPPKFFNKQYVQNQLDRKSKKLRIHARPEDPKVLHDEVKRFEQFCSQKQRGRMVDLQLSARQKAVLNLGLSCRHFTSIYKVWDGLISILVKRQLSQAFAVLTNDYK
jgi:hypothetical protein